MRHEVISLIPTWCQESHGRFLAIWSVQCVRHRFRRRLGPLQMGKVIGLPLLPVDVVKGDCSPLELDILLESLPRLVQVLHLVFLLLPESFLILLNMSYQWILIIILHLIKIN